MRILITGICGFVGSELALSLPKLLAGVEIIGIDNFIRPGSETNRLRLKQAGVRVIHADVRSATDFEALPAVQWVIDAAANPSVLAGVDGNTSSRQLIEHNLSGTINMLEFCKRHKAGFALISTSRVYSAEALAKIPVRATGQLFDFDSSTEAPVGCSAAGIDKQFSVEPPLSLYGASKLASETLAMEYGLTFSLPILINRCGVMAGAGQFGTADQGIFSFWIRSYAARRPLKYIGFGGTGKQVRDAMHPIDLATLLAKQIQKLPPRPTIWNVGGGRDNAMSLAQLSEWCGNRFGQHSVQAVNENRRWDAPWIVMDSSAVSEEYHWQPEVKLSRILNEIAEHHAQNPRFIEISQS
ncbi:MAG TPA: NAD-dependent epimerase/dehydratase family protein [Tepidisphaeraceae bacterium]|jgi:CDP-paratose 2-epimerase|nr:NAD-dependent epimerase/dehydratase family protein [Tepidisphaeraceae bacterium]